MNQRRLGSLIGIVGSALILSACATSTPQTTLPNTSGSNITINLDMDSFNLSSLNQMPTPETPKFTLDLESKAQLTLQAARTKDDLVGQWPTHAASTDAQKSALNLYDICMDH